MTSSNHHNNMDSSKTTLLWYREPWPWFIIAIITTTVCWGVFLLYISMRHADDVVIDDYYKVGKAINRDLRRDQVASALQLQATMYLAEKPESIRVDLSGIAEEWPQQLLLYLQPAARNSEAIVIALVRRTPEAPEYQGIVAQLQAGYYRIQLEALVSPSDTNDQPPTQGAWRLYKNKTLVNHGTLVVLSTTGKT